MALVNGAESASELKMRLKNLSILTLIMKFFNSRRKICGYVFAEKLLTQKMNL
ncbi:MAG: hypothetical protein L6V93_15010 [Clostridiales bacterium]|nr:MAG: hypothetical protein L6V93_15010 [Clostridiales bacterium]